MVGSEYDSMRDSFTRGYIHVYTGDGKGKTTAALGLAVRAMGSGLCVYLGQFIKAGRYSEISSLESLAPKITCEQYGRGCFLFREISEQDRDAARVGLQKARRALLSGEYQVVILDEILVACALGVICEQDVVELMELRPEGVELLLTGRSASQAVIDRADLVTEMREIKHYYRQGVIARRGIES